MWTERTPVLPGSRTLATVADAGFALWDVTDPVHPGVVGLPFAASASDYALSPDGRTLAVVADPNVVLWDLTDRTRLRQPGGPINQALPATLRRRAAW